MKHMIRFAFLLTLLIAPVTGFTQDEDNREQVLERIAAERESMIRNMRLVIENGYVLDANAPSGFIAAILGDSNPDQARHRKALEQQSQANSTAESHYRQVISAEIIAATRGLSRQEATAYLLQRNQDVTRSYTRSRTNASAMLVDRLNRAENDIDRAKAYAMADGMMRTSQLEEEMIQAALRRNGNQDDLARMKDLMRRATGTKVSVSRNDIADDDLREAETFVRRTRLEAQVGEYRRLARSGRLMNPHTGRLEEGASRIHLAEDAERALATELDASALRPSRYDILGWTIPTPDRRVSAEDITQSIQDTPEYAALDYLGLNSGGNQAEHFRALALAVRKQETGVNDWRAGFVKGTDATGVSAIDETVNVIRTGTADFNRILGTAGDMSLDRVDRRIARYHGEADSVVSAFQEAADLESVAARTGARGNPSNLSPTSLSLLRKHGYVAGKSGEEYFAIPASGRTLSGLKSDLNLPGDHLLNAISGENMLEIALTSYIPGAAAGKVGTLLEGLNVSSRGVRAANFATDLAAGVVLDSGIEFAKTGKVDPTRIAIEATMLQSTLGGLSSVTGGTARRMTEYISNKSVQAAAEKSLTQALGLTSEAALQSYYQSTVSGTGMSYETFLANMVNGAMSRGMSHVIEGGAVEGMPDSLKKEISARQQAVNASKAVAAERLKAVLGGDLTGKAGAEANGLRLTPGVQSEALTNKMADALNSGDMTWSELKLLYADNKGLEPVMVAVNERRTQYFSDIVKPAQRAAERELNAEFVREAQRIKKQFADDPAALEIARNRHQSAFDAELKLIRTDPRSPGSGNLTSDVDRSIASERVRRKLKEIYRGDNEGFEIPATSAQSFDVNEYIDVFPIINKTLPLSPELAKLDVETGDFAGLKHEQANQAQGMATAMLHMNDAQRAQYGENVLERSANKELTQRQLELAGKSLDRADGELKAEMNRLSAENPDLARNQGDLAIRARDNLYGTRTEAIRKRATELLHVENDLAALREKGASEDSPKFRELRDKRNELAAEMQRDWGYTLREGIETYSSFTGLDAIVNDGQIPKGASVRQLINDPNYLRLRPGENADHLPDGAKVKRISDSQVENFMNDQVMMMTHHMNGFHSGSEGVVDAGSALGKYAERAVLALKMQGKDVSKPPYDVLNDVSKAMVENRKDPVALKKLMSEMGRKYAGDGTPEAGLLSLAKMIQSAVPETKGLWDPKSMGLSPDAVVRRAASGGSMLSVKAQLANRRRLLQDEEEKLRQFGPASAAQSNRQKQEALKDELQSLSDAKTERERLGSQYLKKDWDRASELEVKNQELERRIDRIRHLRGDLSGGEPLLDELKANNLELDKLKQNYTDAGGTGTYTPDEEDARIDARMAQIKTENALRAAAAERYKSLEVDAAERRANTPAISQNDAQQITSIDGIGFDPSKPSFLQVTLSGTSISVPIKPLE